SVRDSRIGFTRKRDWLAKKRNAVSYIRRRFFVFVFMCWGCAAGRAKVCYVLYCIYVRRRFYFLCAEGGMRCDSNQKMWNVLYVRRRFFFHFLRERCAAA
ncbi:unnamed protein product, partial [Laminaria digitata]